MTVFTVHISDSAAKPDLVLIKDGFSWPAAVFGFLWALAVGAWALALALFVVQVAVSALLPLVIENTEALGVAQLGSAVVIGLVANEARRWFLGFGGLREAGVVTGADKDQAEQRFLDAHPDVTARLLGDQ